MFSLDYNFETNIDLGLPFKMDSPMKAENVQH